MESSEKGKKLKRMKDKGKKLEENSGSSKKSPNSKRLISMNRSRNRSSKTKEIRK